MHTHTPTLMQDCVLCPNIGGAMKVTDSGKWAHVAWARWVPETTFSSADLTGPVLGVEGIPKSRLQLVGGWVWVWMWMCVLPLFNYTFSFSFSFSFSVYSPSYLRSLILF